MRGITAVVTAYLLWAAITHPMTEIRYDYPTRATITTQEGAP